MIIFIIIMFAVIVFQAFEFQRLEERLDRHEKLSASIIDVLHTMTGTTQ